MTKPTAYMTKICHVLQGTPKLHYDVQQLVIDNIKTHPDKHHNRALLIYTYNQFDNPRVLTIQQDHNGNWHYINEDGNCDQHNTPPTWLTTIANETLRQRDNDKHAMNVLASSNQQLERNTAMTTINQDLIHIELSAPLNTTTQLKCENCGRPYTPTEIQYILDHYPHEQTWEEHAWRIHGNHEHKPLNRHSRDATKIIQAMRANGCYGENYYGNINNYPDQTHIPQELQQIAQQLAQHAHQLLPHN